MANYKIHGTNEPYTGRVIKIGDLFYTTQGGGIEGDRQQIIEDTTTNLSQENLTAEIRNEDVVTPFVVGDNTNYGRGTYYYADGTLVPSSTKLHHHTIVPSGRSSNFMTQHVMDGNDVDVFLTPSNNRRMSQPQQNQAPRATDNQTPRSTGNITGGPSNNNPGGNVGGGTGGGMGGGGSY
tara:strand:- start:197 stop:736 length:540 start_codon:yes stop_codon:yes gene_type:complete